MNLHSATGPAFYLDGHPLTRRTKNMAAGKGSLWPAALGGWLSTLLSAATTRAFIFDLCISRYSLPALQGFAKYSDVQALYQGTTSVVP
jgi:hypothetical protein